MSIERLGNNNAIGLEQAAEWRLRIDADATIVDGEAFRDWFALPENRDAYARICATWDVFDEHQVAPQILAIRTDALTRARRASLRRLLPTRRYVAAAAAVFLLVLGAGVGSWLYLKAPAEYLTGIGERRVVTLEDGSRISLDSDTAVNVLYTPKIRQLVLERGRARFDVAHNTNRPFTVRAGNETVVAVGTSFNVERLGRKVLVTLIEGRVVVKSADGRHHETISEFKPVAMKAGELLVASVLAKPEITPASLPVATAWESGRLVLNDEPLGEAVERINRYTDRPLAVDPAIAQLRINGVFNAGDVNAFIDAITSYFPVQASVNERNQTVLQKRL